MIKPFFYILSFGGIVYVWSTEFLEEKNYKQPNLNINFIEDIELT